MIPPHGNKLVDRCLGGGRTSEFRADFSGLVTINLSQNLVFDFANLANGVYSPLTGFLGRNDFMKVVNDLTLESGVVWPLPIVLDVPADLANKISPGERVGIRDATGTPVGLMDVDDVYRYNESEMCLQLFGTTDRDHPGVRFVHQKGPYFVGGQIKAFRDAFPRSGPYDLTPKETRVLFKNRGWETVVGFQTRNVPHRAHEYLQKSALENVDGLFIQPKIGEKKQSDYTNNAILQGYETLVNHYYPSDVVSLSVFKSRMWYAGPREAVFDSIIRKNHGCTHFIIGRDHAGVGDYYGDFEAQRLFEDLGAVGIEPLYYHYAFYCDACDGIASEKICPHDSDQRLEPSGTKLRSMLSKGETPPPELMRPEVAEEILGLDDILVER